MKSLFVIVASVFALSAMAQTAPAKKEEAKPAAKVEKKDAQPSKSTAPAVKETKTATPASK